MTCNNTDNTLKTKLKFFHTQVSMIVKCLQLQYVEFSDQVFILIFTSINQLCPHAVP